jgi:hypothetical protein
MLTQVIWTPLIAWRLSLIAPLTQPADQLAEVKNS